MLFYLDINKLDKMNNSNIVLVTCLPEQYSITTENNIINLDAFITSVETCNGSEERYKKNLNKFYKYFLISIAYWLNKKIDIVLVYDKKFAKQIGFNYAKCICKVINKRYGFSYSEYDDNLDIREIDVDMDEDQYFKYISDLKLLGV